MFRIRRPSLDDVPTLLKLAKMVYFINLPADQGIITRKILQARASFQAAGEGVGPADADRSKPVSLGGFGDAVQASELFMFVLEDLEAEAVIGTSQIIAQMGGPGNPIVSLKLSKREFWSNSLQSGATHAVARLHLDDSGPTEIGGLILQPSYRKHKQRLGRFLSLVRFHFMGLHRERFADRVVAEMMAPLSIDGQSLLWDYLGRRFINLSYAEADRFCQTSRDFMTDLLPDTEIYLTLLPPEARVLVGKVGPETEPAKAMLEKLGFVHRDLVDPFDGGPYLDAKTSEISIVKQTSFATLGPDVQEADCDRRGMISHLTPDGEFFAIDAPCTMRGEVVCVPEPMRGLLQAELGARIGLTLSPERSAGRTARGSASKASTNASSASTRSSKRKPTRAQR